MCAQVEAHCQENAADQNETCLEVGAAPAGQATLKVLAYALRGPVVLGPEGREFSYEIQVTNAGAVADQEVAVSASVPDGMLPVTLGTTGPAEATLEGQTFHFAARHGNPAGQKPALFDPGQGDQAGRLCVPCRSKRPLDRRQESGRGGPDEDPSREVTISRLPMPRFVVLYHEHPPRSHWDLMLENGAVLRTWPFRRRRTGPGRSPPGHSRTIGRRTSIMKGPLRAAGAK